MPLRLLPVWAKVLPFPSQRIQSTRHDSGHYTSGGLIESSRHGSFASRRSFQRHQAPLQMGVVLGLPAIVLLTEVRTEVRGGTGELHQESNLFRRADAVRVRQVGPQGKFVRPDSLKKDVLNDGCVRVGVTLGGDNSASRSAVFESVQSGSNGHEVNPSSRFAALSTAAARGTVARHRSFVWRTPMRPLRHLYRSALPRSIRGCRTKKSPARTFRNSGTARARVNH